MIHANYRTLSRTEESYRTIIVLDRETTDRKPIVVLLFSNVTFIASREKKERRQETNESGYSDLVVSKHRTVLAGYLTTGDDIGVRTTELTQSYGQVHPDGEHATLLDRTVPLFTVRFRLVRVADKAYLWIVDQQTVRRVAHKVFGRIVNIGKLTDEIIERRTAVQFDIERTNANLVEQRSFVNPALVGHEDVTFVVSVVRHRGGNGARPVSTISRRLRREFSKILRQQRRQPFRRYEATETFSTVSIEPIVPVHAVDVVRDGGDRALFVGRKFGVFSRQSHVDANRFVRRHIQDADFFRVEDAAHVETVHVHHVRDFAEIGRVVQFTTEHVAAELFYLLRQRTAAAGVDETVATVAGSTMIATQRRRQRQCSGIKGSVVSVVAGTTMTGGRRVVVVVVVVIA